jgi:hypothetical protein
MSLQSCLLLYCLSPQASAKHKHQLLTILQLSIARLQSTLAVVGGIATFAPAVCPAVVKLDLWRALAHVLSIPGWQVGMFNYGFFCHLGANHKCQLLTHLQVDIGELQKSVIELKTTVKVVGGIAAFVPILLKLGEAFHLL